MKILVTGATGLTGSLFLNHLAEVNPGAEVDCLIRPTSDHYSIEHLNLNLSYFIGDSETSQTWDELLSKYTPETIIHIASIRHVPVILQSLEKAGKSPRFIVIGTTGVYSQYNHYSATYKNTETQLANYPGSCCLLRPTMIYGSHRDKNLHKLIKFCDHYQFFPIFGQGNNLLQPIHAEDLAQAIVSVLLNPNITGAYDLSGGTVITLVELIALVEKILEKSVYPLQIPYALGLWSATIIEKILGKRSPIRREQVLRLQEDKAYPHESATRDFDFAPRSLDTGLREEVDIMRTQGII